MSLWNLAQPQLRDLVAYETGKPIEDVARELGLHPDEIVKLASNENPLGPSPKALVAMHRAIDLAHFYPDGAGYYLREAIAKKHTLGMENVILGNGSNEIIEFLGHAFLNPEAEVIASKHAFVVYKLMASLFGAKFVEVPDPNFTHDLRAMAEAITPRTRQIFVANPNNPTGTIVSQAEIDAFMARVPEHATVIFDEAYYEYLDQPPDTLKYVREGRNVIILRTFSKIQGLASTRIGYGLAPKELVDVLQKTRQPFNANGIAQAGALAGLLDQEHQRETKRVNDEGRAYLQTEFAALGRRFVPSYANFVLVHVGDGKAVFQALLRRGLIVRPMAGYGLPEWLRISVGTMEQNRKLIAALREILAA
ncbi:MAG: histidinol-phosphate transaminase [Verrucomicrobia bacterium]|nr:histidinol-phosphate transaminase [Verrucomicrobiota bacterium]